MQVLKWYLCMISEGGGWQWAVIAEIMSSNSTSEGALGDNRFFYQVVRGT